jgi:hypothetical protein
MTIEVYVLEQGTYLLAGQYTRKEVAPSQVIAGFEVPVGVIFAP